MVALAKLPPWMTVTEFLAWDAGDDQKWQLVDGQPCAMAPATIAHCRLQSGLNRLIGNYLELSHRPCDVIVNPGIIPATMSAHNMRIPDLAASCSPNDFSRTALIDPVLIIEILSPSNRAQTWANVWAYTTISSVREILILHSDILAGYLLRRRLDGSWPEQPRVIEENLTLDCIGFHVAMADIYRLSPIDQS